MTRFDTESDAVITDSSFIASSSSSGPSLSGASCSEPDGFIEELAAFIAMQSVIGYAGDNAAVVRFLTMRLEALGFAVRIEGADESDQPLIIAKRAGSSSPALVLYNHYDVEAIGDDEQWLSDPFVLTQRDARLWARGIADNKAVLLARLAVIEARVQQGKPLPDMVWIIQGEEEVGSMLAHRFLPAELDSVDAFICLEETGYVREGVPLLFYRSSRTDNGEEHAHEPMLHSLNAALFDGAGRFENRTMSKFGPCPLVSNLPGDALYIGFGPNDYQARIHRDNESMSVELLVQYHDVFDRFLGWVVDEIVAYVVDDVVDDVVDRAAGLSD